MKLIANLSEIDRQAIDGLGIPGDLLMEEAGRQVAEVIAQTVLPALEKQAPTVTIVCGPGNNGGDGFVCARKLLLYGVQDIRVVVLSEPNPKKAADAVQALALLQHYPIEVMRFEKELEVSDLEALSDCLVASDVVVDALFGSGLARPITGRYADVIQAMNESRTTHNMPCVAVDLPSGICAETGRVLGDAVAVEADTTVTLCSSKPGLHLPVGRYHAGEIVVVDIGMPAHLLTQAPSPTALTTREQVQVLMQSALKPYDRHKYSVGCTLIVAGSETMPGAARLSAESALRSGAGMVAGAGKGAVIDGDG